MKRKINIPKRNKVVPTYNVALTLDQGDWTRPI